MSRWSPIQKLGWLVTLLLVLLLVWPTPWIYVGTGQGVTRIHRVTGCFQHTTPDGWSRPAIKPC